MKNHFPKILVPGLLASLIATQVQAVDYHVATAQALQNDLTLAAASSVSNNIYVTNGYYTGNFNYNSSNINSLMILAETNVASSQIVIDSGGTGSSMNITATASPFITVQGLTFLRNCGSTSIGGLRIAAGNTTILVNGCSFLSPTDSSGIGLLLVSGINATVTNCIVVGSQSGGGGTGIFISGITNNVTVQNCALATNRSGLFISDASVLGVTGCLFEGNSGAVNQGSADGSGALCVGTTITLSGNSFIGNLGANGYFVDGGAACCIGTTVTLSGNAFTGNSDPFGNSVGGAAFCEGSTLLTLTGNAFTGNSTGALGGGGGACCEGSTIILSGNTFTSNTGGGDGGGGVCCLGTTTLSNNIFIGNSTVQNGGGVYCSSSATNPMTVSGNTFQQNTAGSGGGLYVSGPTINLLDNLVADNSATNTSSQGGGVWVDASATLNMVNNTVTGNSSADNGGGVAYIVTGTVELLNVYNNIIWGNLATVNGGDVYLSGTGQKKVFDFNDVDSMYGVWDIAQNNIDLSPQFFEPVNGDYHTQSTSPCRNAGTNGAPSLPLTDLDGNSRTNSAGLVDMGCYEFNTTATHPADTDTNFVITAAEFNSYAAAWKTGQTWTNAPNPIPANYVTRAGYLMTNGGAYTNDGSARPVNWKIGR